MARGRTYARDTRGRFASGGSGTSRSTSKGGRATVTGGTLGARSSLARSRRKLAANASPQQKAAVTRGTKGLTAARRSATRAVPAVGARGTVGKGGKRRNGARPVAGGRNSIRAIGGALAQSRRPRSSVKPFRPATDSGQMDRIDRRIDRAMKATVDELKGLSDRMKKAKPAMDRFSLRVDRSIARAIANRRAKGIDGEIARAELSAFPPPLRKGAMALIRGRATRASAAAARGSKPARRAQEVYANQLAAMGPGKPAKGRNNRQPGPRNKQGPPKKRRGGGKRKPKA